jgi:hypothetical protein
MILLYRSSNDLWPRLTMPSCDGSMFEMIGILAVLALVVANGFFVAA